jgi:DNA-binding transcriptional regulator YdaS (Cro superfamily)
MNEIDTTLIRQAVTFAGGQKAMAAKLGVTQGLVSNWCCGNTIMPRHFSNIASVGGISHRKLAEAEMHNSSVRDQLRSAGKWARSKSKA